MADSGKKPKGKDAAQVETDSRFPSGPWKGFFLQPRVSPDRGWMDLQLEFTDGRIKGTGSDRVGKFSFVGRYDLTSGRVDMSKRYAGDRVIDYTGWAEGDRGIYGAWIIRPRASIGGDKGGFLIWPKGMADPTGASLAAEADTPRDVRREEAGEPATIGPVTNRDRRGDDEESVPNRCSRAFFDKGFGLRRAA